MSKPIKPVPSYKLTPKEKLLVSRINYMLKKERSDAIGYAGGEFERTVIAHIRQLELVQP